MMEAFHTLAAVAAPLDRANVDTEVIIPIARILGTGRGQLGPYCLEPWRVDANGDPDPSFFINDPRYRGARILVAGENFGCGSSREMAVWALWDLGIRVVIAESFGDIFRANCFQNGLLAITLSKDEVARLMREIRTAPESLMVVNLAAGRITTPLLGTIPFTIDAERRDALLEGLDEVGMTLKLVLDINAFERRDRIARPWAYSGLEIARSP